MVQDIIAIEYKLISEHNRLGGVHYSKLVHGVQYTNGHDAWLSESNLCVYKNVLHYSETPHRGTHMGMLFLSSLLQERCKGFGCFNSVLFIY